MRNKSIYIINMIRTPSGNILVHDGVSNLNDESDKSAEAVTKQSYLKSNDVVSGQNITYCIMI